MSRSSNKDMPRLLYIWYFWAFSIYQDTPEIPIGLLMEHAFFSTEKFPERMELVKR